MAACARIIDDKNAVFPVPGRGAGNTASCDRPVLPFGLQVHHLSKDAVFLEKLIRRPLFCHMAV